MAALECWLLHPEECYSLAIEFYYPDTEVILPAETYGGAVVCLAVLAPTGETLFDVEKSVAGLSHLSGLLLHNKCSSSAFRNVECVAQIPSLKLLYISDTISAEPTVAWLAGCGQLRCFVGRFL